MENLPQRITEEDLRSIFSEYGIVKQVYISNNAEVGSFAFVEMIQ